MPANREVEIKLRVPDAATARRLLARHGFRIVCRRTFEANVIFDTPSASLEAAGSLLRVRRYGRANTITFKGPSGRAKHKIREEIESEIADADAIESILVRLGLAPVFRYEKYRAEYSEPGGHGLLTLDETPIGTFLELEGRPPWIDRTARRLGFDESDYITASYGLLYREYRARHPEAPVDMVFIPATAGASTAKSSFNAQQERLKKIRTVLPRAGTGGMLV